MTRLEFAQKMLANGATPDEIKAAAAAGKAKGLTFDDESPAPETDAEAFFPRASKATSLPGKILGGALDIASLPGRAIDSRINTLKTGKEAPMGKIHGDNFGEDVLLDPATIPASLVGAEEGNLALKAAEALPRFGKYAPEVIQGIKQGLVSAGTHQAENVDEGKGIKPLQAAEEVAGSAAAVPVLNRVVPAVVEGGRKLLGGASELLSGIPEKALSTFGFGTGQGAKDLAAAHGTLPEIAKDMVTSHDDSYINNPLQSHYDAIDKALENIPDRSMESAIEAARNAKVAPIKGHITDEARAGNAKIDDFIEVLHGRNPFEGQIGPRDFLGDLAKAKKVAEEHGYTVDELKDLVDASTRKTDAAAAKFKNKLNQASTSAAAVPGLNKKAAAASVSEFGHPVDIGAEPSVFDEGQAYQGLGDKMVSTQQALTAGISKARKAAADAKSAFESSKATESVTGIHADILAKAEKKLASANKEVAIAEAADALATIPSKTPDTKVDLNREIEVASDIVKNHGYTGQDLSDILAEAKQRAEADYRVVDHTMSAPDYRQFRSMIDDVTKLGPEGTVTINSPGTAILNKAKTAVRSTMKNELLLGAEGAAQKAKASGDQDLADLLQAYGPNMKEVARKKALISTFESKLGKDPTQRVAKAEEWLRSIPKENNQSKIAILQGLQDIYGKDWLDKSQLAYYADEIGPGGVAPLVPDVKRGKATQLIGLGGLGAFSHYHPVLSGASAALASPRVAAGALATADAVAPVLKRTLPRALGVVTRKSIFNSNDSLPQFNQR